MRAENEDPTSEKKEKKIQGASQEVEEDAVCMSGRIDTSGAQANLCQEGSYQK